MTISRTIKSVRDIMRKDVGVDGDAQRIGQLVWMLFLKIFDDRETEWEMLHEQYTSPLPETYRWRNWASNKEGITGDELKEFIDNSLFPALRTLEETSVSPMAFVIRDVFNDTHNYMKSGQLIRQVLNQLEAGIDFNKAQERHSIGEMYEGILRDLQNAGNAGEFYTPRAVTEFMVRMIDPKLEEIVMDPACGTGGFLTCTIEHKRRNYVRTADDERLLQSTIRGVEKKPLPHLLATTNMVLHGIEVPSQVRRDNTLAKPLISWGPSDRVDCIVANPPFGGMEEDGIESNFPTAFRTRETADLFMTLIIHLLKDGGRAAVVLPDGFLFGEGIKSRIKERLLQTCNLHTIVRLPKGVFNPYAPLQTNILFFEKGVPTRDVWFYEHPYPPGYKNYSKTKPIRFEEFAAEQAWWGKSADGFSTRHSSPYAWKVSVEELVSRNYNLDCRNPHLAAEEVQDPEALLAQHYELENEIASLRDELKTLLSGSLGYGA